MELDFERRMNRKLKKVKMMVMLRLRVMKVVLWW